MNNIKALALIGTLGFAGCDNAIGPTACTDILVFGISVQVVDDVSGEGRADAATMTLRDGPYQEVVDQSFDGRTLFGAAERAGIYSVTIEHPSYVTWSASDIVVAQDFCHVIPATFTARLQPQP